MEKRPSLIDAHDLIRESWHAFRLYWNQTIVVSKWLLLGPIITFLLVLITRPWASTQSWLSFIGNVVTVVVSLLVAIRLTWHIWDLETKKTEKNKLAFTAAVFWSYLWVQILTGAAIIGGLILFVLPGIWLTILFAFSGFEFLIEGRRGTQALAASAALVKGRWLATLWRVVAPAVVFLILYAAIVALIGLLVGLLAGWVKVTVIVNPALASTDPLVSASQGLIQGLATAIFAPLFLWAEIKLYNSLKITR